MPAKRRVGITAVATLLLVSAGCRPEAPPVETAPPEPAAVDSADTSTQVPPPPAVLPASLTRSIRFLHNPHRDINCRLCHTSIPGHSRHSTVQCGECHALPGETAGADVAPAECNGCHHAATQTLTCSHCHTSAPAAVYRLNVAIRVSVRASTTQRELLFDHSRHRDVECTECHADRPAVGSPRPCSACHTQHHRNDAQCANCHPPMPMELHDASAHRGCGGAGCHQDQAVNALSGRQTCLVCHRAQVDHEPGEQCSRCHLFRTGTPASGAP